MEILGEIQVFGPAGKHQLLPVHLFILVPGDDMCPFCLVECVEMVCDIAGVEFHAGEILHLIRYEKVEVGDAVGTSIKNQDTAFSESWFDLLVGDLEMDLVIDVSGLYAESYGKL